MYSKSCRMKKISFGMLQAARIQRMASVTSACSVVSFRCCCCFLNYPSLFSKLSKPIFITQLLPKVRSKVRKQSWLSYYMLPIFAFYRCALCVLKFLRGCQRQRSTSAELMVVPCVLNVSVTGEPTAN